MGYWFGTFTPPRVLLEIGSIHLYWYSVLIVFGIAAALFIARWQYARTHPSDKLLLDAAFWAIVGGIVGARLWHVFVFQWAYYAERPAEILRIWEGGIAIQGALVGGVIALIIYARRHSVTLRSLTDAIALGLPLGQLIGRWGNYFNQELYGRPTDAPWGIFIDKEHRVPGFESFEYFHPTFFYESMLNGILFVVLLALSRRKNNDGFLTGAYVAGYGLIRFLVDFVRIDPMPMVGALRYSQYISLVLVAVGLCLLLFVRRGGGSTIAKAE